MRFLPLVRSTKKPENYDSWRLALFRAVPGPGFTR
jgi:hypothetical protein